MLKPKEVADAIELRFEFALEDRIIWCRDVMELVDQRVLLD